MVLPTSPMFLLLFMFLLVSWGSPGPSQAETCSAADLALAEGDVTVTTIKGGQKIKHLSGSLFVRRETLFNGVSVWAQGSMEKTGAWFALSGKCFWQKAWWWEIGMTASIGMQINGVYTPGLYFTVRVKDCQFACRSPKNTTHLLSLSVAAHGSSNWRFTLPDVSCPTVWLNSSASISTIWNTCENPPNPKPPRVIGKITPSTRPPLKKSPNDTMPVTPVLSSTQNPSESLPVAAANPAVVVVNTVVVAAVMVLVAAVMVAVKVYKKQRRTTEDAGYITPQVLPPNRPRPQLILWCRQQQQQQQQQQTQFDSDATYENKSELYLKVI